MSAAEQIIATDIATDRAWSARLRAILDDNADVAERNGFDRPTWQNVPAKLAFALTEIREADGAASSDLGDPLAWTTEILDYVLRVGAVLVVVFPGWAVRATRDGVSAAAARRSALWRPAWTSLRPIAHATCDAIQQWRGGEERRAAHVATHLECGIRDALMLYASATGHDADRVLDDLAAVVERNRRRKARHGHAESAG